MRSTSSRQWLRMFVVFVSITVTVFILTYVLTRGARAALATDQQQDVTARAQIADAESYLAQYPATQRAFVLRRATRLGLADVTASAAEIQGRFTEYLGAISRIDHVGIGGTPNCPGSAFTSTTYSGLSGLHCTYTFVGKLIPLLDATRRLSSESPVLAQVVQVKIARNNDTDLTANPTLAETVDVYLDRASMPIQSPTPGVQRGAN